MVDNATFMSFRKSGKWYATERGNLTPDVFITYDRQVRRRMICNDNGGKYPGLATTGADLTFVVLPDDDVDFGFPLMLFGE